MTFSKLYSTSRSLLLATIIIFGSGSNSALATIVQFQTNLGNFDVNLYDQRTPNTVANFLTYTNDGDYSNTIIHRVVTDFIIQGGGLIYNQSWPVDVLANNAAVANEPVFSNVRGTIAMAKIGGAPDSATNQWFFNLVDNSTTGAALDSQNSGFTVFGEVMGNGMDIVDQIAVLPTFDFGGAVSEIPLQNYTSGTDPDGTNLVIITSIIVLDASDDTAAAINPPLNNTQNPTPTPPSSSGGGGSLGFLFLSLLAFSRLGKSSFRTRLKS